MANRRPACCVILTSPFALNAFLLPQLGALADRYDVTVCVNALDGSVSARLDPRVELIHLDIRRPVSLISDLRALLTLVRLLRARRFDAVQTLTPKGGLLGMIAARITRTPIRIHVFTGQVWATQRGVARWVLKTMDRLLAACATDLLADSPSQARFLEAERVCPPRRVNVLGAGSLGGVDLYRFSPVPGRRDRIRGRLGVPPDAPVFLFLGRLQRDKGVMVLANAFRRLAARYPEPHLIWVGPDEGRLAHHVQRCLPDRSHLIGPTASPEDYLDASDILVLPSFREGFGTVVIEAAAMGLPTVASRIYGLIDAVSDDETGRLVPVGDEESLLAAMESLLDATTRGRLGRRARERTRELFSATLMTARWLDFYRVRLGEGRTANLSDNRNASG